MINSPPYDWFLISFNNDKEKIQTLLFIKNGINKINKLINRDFYYLGFYLLKNKLFKQKLMLNLLFINRQTFSFDKYKILF